MPRSKRFILCAKCPVEKSMEEIKEVLKTLPSVKEDVVTGGAIDELEKSIEDWENDMF